jgi:two-component system response regulator AtoC
MNERRRPDFSLDNFHGIISGSPQMRRLFTLIERVAVSEASVLLRGETGTGKELAAAAIHRLSPRYARAFQAVNCATLTPELAASELFGHIRGAFTGAIAHRKGIFEVADNGTIFLDEVAELGVEIQGRLLRVLQERTFVPVGAVESRRVDIRLIAATHKSLREEVEAKRFREDLMYRIRVVPLFIPPLVERDGDLEALTWTFIDEFNQKSGRHIQSISGDAWDAMQSYWWPGNVRELRNAIEYAFAIGEGPSLGAEDLPPELRGEIPPKRLMLRHATHHLAPTGIESPSDLRASEELERGMIVEALQRANGSKSGAAEQLGISRTTLWRKMRELRLLNGPHSQD